MVVLELLKILEDVNQQAPVLIEYLGSQYEVDSISVQNGVVLVERY